MSSHTTYRPQLIQDYEQIAQNNVAQKVSFYRKNEQKLKRIPYLLRHHIDQDYLLALFQSGHYSEYLLRTEGFIARLFDSALFQELDQKALEKTLFYKSACEFNLQNYTESEKTIKELILLQKEENLLIEELLIKINIKTREPKNRQVRGLVIVLILTSAILNAWNVLVVDSFSPGRLETYQMIAWSTLGLALVFWVGEVRYNKHCARKETLRIVMKGKKRKALREEL